MSSIHYDADPLAQGGDDRARREFLTFSLGEETYGIDILKVQEIRELDAVTRVPHVSAFVRGVINLRGAIVPIVDLGLMFGFPAPIKLTEASAIVMNVDHRMVGLIVASVSDVLALADDEITAAPDLGDRQVANFVSGIGTRDAFSILLLDVERILGRIREDTP